MKQINYLSFLVLFSLIFNSCNNQISTKLLQGTWNVTDVEINVPNANDILIKNAEEISYATQYTFTKDSTVIITIADTAIDKAIKYEGYFVFEEKNSKIRFKIDKVAVKNIDEWQYLDKNKFSSQMFKDFLYSVESVSSKEIILLEKEGKDGTLKFTLTKQ